VSGSIGDLHVAVLSRIGLHPSRLWRLPKGSIEAPLGLPIEQGVLASVLGVAIAIFLLWVAARLFGGRFSAFPVLWRKSLDGKFAPRLGDPDLNGRYIDSGGAP
jgi:hypothetical protein